MESFKALLKNSTRLKLNTKIPIQTPYFNTSKEDILSFPELKTIELNESQDLKGLFDAETVDLIKKCQSRTLFSKYFSTDHSLKKDLADAYYVLGDYKEAFKRYSERNKSGLHFKEMKLYCAMQLNQNLDFAWIVEKEVDEKRRVRVLFFLVEYFKVCRIADIKEDSLSKRIVPNENNFWCTRQDTILIHALLTLSPEFEALKYQFLIDVARITPRRRVLSVGLVEAAEFYFGNGEIASGQEAISLVLDERNRIKEMDVQYKAEICKEKLLDGRVEDYILCLKNKY